MAKSPIAIVVDGQDPGNSDKRQAINTSGQAAIQDQPNMDVAMSTVATQATLASVLTKLDITVSALRDAIVGTGPKTLTDVEITLDAIKDTDGIKKIQDGLPAGENILGQVKITDGTDIADVITLDGINYLAAGKANCVDANNSSTMQLDPGGTNTFVGTATDVSQYSSVAITIHSNEDSIVDGMKFEFSIDGTNWDDSYSFNLDADTSQTRRFQFPVTAQYFRVNYINGDTITTAFRCQTILHRENILTSIHRIENAVKEDRSAQLVKSAIIAQREGASIQDFYPVLADVSGNLKVTTVGSDIPSDPSAFVLKFLRDSSENQVMLVNGEITPVVFSKGPTVADEIWSIRELLLTFSADDFTFDGVSFGPNVALINGFSIEVVKNSISTEVFRVIQNEDFLRVPGRTPLVNNTGPKDILGAALSFQGLVLDEANGDKVQITIRDDLTSVKYKYLTATLFAVKVL